MSTVCFVTVWISLQYLWLLSCTLFNIGFNAYFGNWSITLVIYLFFLSSLHIYITMYMVMENPQTQMQTWWTSG